MKSLLIILAAFFLQMPAFAKNPSVQQRAKGLYNSLTEKTYNGTIITVDSIEKAGPSPSEIYLIAKVNADTTADTTTIFIGPTSFVNGMNFSMKSGDSIRVTGGNANFEGRPVIIAKDITIGNQTLKLRDDSGAPLWKGKQ